MSSECARCLYLTHFLKDSKFSKNPSKCNGSLGKSNLSWKLQKKSSKYKSKNLQPHSHDHYNVPVHLLERFNLFHKLMHKLHIRHINISEAQMNVDSMIYISYLLFIVEAFMHRRN